MQDQDVYSTLLRSESDVLKKLNAPRAAQTPSLYNASLVTTLAMFAGTWRSIIDDVFAQGEGAMTLRRMHTILTKDDRKIHLGIMLCFAGLFLYFADIF